MARRVTATSGILIVDKPAGWTSHDVVARVRRLAGTRRVGHAGTLDPMATGVLVIGVERATRLLGHLTLSEKAYEGTIRLGQRSVTDDAEGEITGGSSAAHVSEAAVRAAAFAFTGDIAQVPPQFSAVKVQGIRSYKRARQAQEVELAARPVSVRTFEPGELRRTGRMPDVLDVDVTIECTSGTYVRALARDLGEYLSVGGHLTMLRRTSVGPYRLGEAHTLEQLAESFSVLPLADAVANTFPRRDVSADQANRVAHGGWLPAAGFGEGPVGVFGQDGALLALMEEREGSAKPLAVFA